MDTLSAILNWTYQAVATWYAAAMDPFLGSGTTSVVAKKLGRKYIGIEAEEEYALLAERRLEMAAEDRAIQGYAEGVFWERNTLNVVNGRAKRATSIEEIEPSPLLL